MKDHPRLLLLLPTKTYRTKDFMEAARRLEVEVVVASEEASTFADKNPRGMMVLDFLDPDGSAPTVIEFAKSYPIDAVVGVDDETSIAASTLSAMLGLPHNSVESAMATRDKYRMRQLLAQAQTPVPQFSLFSIGDEPSDVAQRVEYPCVLKPTFLAASQGVIRANNETEFIAAFRKIKAILGDPEIASRGGPAARRLLVESYVPGVEVALEGLLTDGELRLLALFDKPDPLVGPFFEETIYVTPSRLAPDAHSAIVECAAHAAAALGLRHGPLHAELRINERGPWVIEVAARSIGGLCSRTLRFEKGVSLEELILRHALGMNVDSILRERQAAGVMMIPIPRAGILRAIRGLAAARAVSNIEDITITAHIGQTLVAPPGGSRYLGFIFSRAETPECAEAVLRQAHSRLDFIVSDR